MNQPAHPGENAVNDEDLEPMSRALRGGKTRLPIERSRIS